jgi:adenylate cyclase
LRPRFSAAYGPPQSRHAGGAGAAFRIGINLGDVIVEDGDIFGDGVNVATQLETLAEPGGVCISGGVRGQVGDRGKVGYADLGEQQVKNITRPIRVYKVLIGCQASEAGHAPQTLHARLLSSPKNSRSAFCSSVI